MRTTVGFPPVRARALEIAERTGRSLSHVIADVAVRGFSRLDQPMATDDRSGFPVLTTGRPITLEQVAAALDEE